MSEKKLPSLKVSVVSNWVLLVVNIVTGLILTPRIIDHLGEKGFGVWTLVTSIVGYFGILRLGMGTGVLRYVSFYRGKNDYYKVSQNINTAIAAYAIVGIIIFTLSQLLAKPISDFFGGDHVFVVLIRIIGAAAAIECLTQILDTAIRAYERYFRVSLIGISSSILRATSLLIAISLDYTILAMGWIILFISLFNLLMTFIIFEVSCKKAKLGLQYLSKEELVKLFAFGLLMLVISCAELLNNEIPKQIIAKAISFEAIGLFGVVLLLLKYGNRTIQSLSKVFMPRFSFLSGGDSEHVMQDLFIRATRYCVIIAGIITAGIWSVGPSFLKLWIPRDVSTVIPILFILNTSSFVILSHRLSLDLLYGIGCQKAVAVIEMSIGVTVALLCLIFVWKWQMLGVAIGISLPRIFFRAIIQPYWACKSIRLNYFDYLLKTKFLQVSGLSGLIFFMSRVIDIDIRVTNWWDFFVYSSVISVLYISVCFWVIMNRKDREYILSILKIRRS